MIEQNPAICLRRTLAMVCSTVMLACPDLTAQTGPGDARVPVKIIDGKLVVSCEVSTPARRLPANLFVEYESKCALQLHNKLADGLKCERPDGSTVPITVHLGDEFEITVARREHGDETFYDDFTKYHSVELGENAAAGTIGSEILSRHFSVFDLANGFLYLGPPRAEDPDARAPVDGQVVVPLTEVNGLGWLPVRYADGSAAALALGTARYDTTLDLDVCDRFGKPAGDIEALRIGDDIELTDFIALRPQRVVQVHPDGVAGVLGLNVLEHFRVEVDRVNRVARFAQTVEARFPEADLAFFRAVAEDDADELAAFLEQYPDQRLSREAAELLLAMRLDEDADAPECRLALECLFATYPEDLRATAMLDQVEALRQLGRPRLAVLAGEIGIPAGRTDRYPNSVHRLHAQVGEVQLELGDRKPAWEHLLSAAFGLPEDGMINYHLGRFYEAEGRLRRAYSRYVQAVIKPDSGPKALEALHRLQSRMDGAERMSVDQIEKLTAGKTHAFGAATVYRPDGVPTNRVALIEFFTNANLGDATRGGSIGGALANDGLVSHFTDEHAAFITWHLLQPELVPMAIEFGVDRAARIGARPDQHRINGVRKGPGASKWRDKEKVYNACRQLVVAALAEPSEFDIEVDAWVDGDRVHGQVVVRGPEAAPGARVNIVMVERGVLFPGRSEILIHRNVARASLTAVPGGLKYRAVDGVMRIPFETTLEVVRRDNEDYLDYLMAAGRGTCAKVSMVIDPQQVGVVAFVRDSGTGEVLQARQVRATVAEAQK